MGFVANIIKFKHNVLVAFKEQFGFKIQEASIEKITDYFYSPKDPSSLAVTRILFGLAMLFDIPDERGGSTMDTRWGDKNICHFPLLPIIQPIPLPFMGLVYTAMWIGALGIMLGYKFRMSAMIFATCYWYLFLIEKSFWNNHSYLFGLVSMLLIGIQANNYLSLDMHLHPKSDRTVPYWNYFVLKYQFFILYFFAGLKKGTAEWLTGYSLVNLSEHWVFDPFKLLLSVSQTDYLVVHWFAFLFDLTVAFWMMHSRTRHVAMLFCAAFHLMNIRLFRIGMFPWVCLATMPLYYPFDWPKIICKQISERLTKITQLRKVFYDNKLKIVSENDANTNDDGGNESNHGNEQINDDQINYENNMAVTQAIVRSECRKSTTWIIFIYMSIQAFMPYSHFITKGYNNWTNGLYGYSWDMMVHSWEAQSVTLKIIDNERGTEFYLDPYAMTPNDRWTRHADMVYQYAHCLKDKLKRDFNFLNMSIYIDVLYSMNGRFQQRMFDSKVDLLRVTWSPFEETPWLMPLLTDAEDWRSTIDELRVDVYTWSNYTDVIFVADFPGYNLEKYISEDLDNVTLSVLQGIIAYEPDLSVYSKSIILNSGEKTAIKPATFHKVHTLGHTPSYYMYTFVNNTAQNLSIQLNSKNFQEKLPIVKEVTNRLHNMAKFLKLVAMSLFQIFFQMPLSIMSVICTGDCY